MPKSNVHKSLDKALFEQLFKSHFVHLCNFAHQYVSDTDSARDITQKVFLKLWENRATIDPQQSIQSYLFTSVKNRCLNHIRDQKKYRSRFLDVEMEDFEMNFEEDAFALSELQDKIDEALDALPEKCRKVFEMSRFRDMKYQAIADELEVSVKTVEAHMSKALKSLRAHLKDYLYFLVLWLLENIG